ncbi:MAG: WG repeat-containing protein [Duncaniella sp.]|nr:WG repeat-containing protein [Duncaniella sp.]
MRHLFLSFLTILTALWVNGAEKDPVATVSTYQRLLNGYLGDDDIEMREEIDQLLRGGQNKCYISNMIGNAVAKERNLSIDRLHSDTYHNHLEQWHKNGVLDKVDFSNISWLKDWEEPRLNIGNQMPVKFVSANVSTTGSRPFNCSDLFFVQNDKIVSIENLGAGGLGYAIQLYNQKKYDEAFALFRTIASTNRSSLKARYYTAVMLITGKGSKHLNSKVRDHEAAWLGLSGMLMNDEDLTALAYKFSMHLKFTENEVILYPASFNGRRVVKNGDKYGIMDDSGKMILPMRKGICSPLSGHGYAVVSIPEGNKKKKGLIDSNGNQIVAFEYDDILPYSHDGNFVAVKDGYLVILTTSGSVVKRIPGAFTGLGFATTDGHMLVANGRNPELYNFEGQLEMDENQFNAWTFNKVTGELRLGNKDGKDFRIVRSLDTEW